MLAALVWHLFGLHQVSMREIERRGRAGTWEARVLGSDSDLLHIWKGVTGCGESWLLFLCICASVHGCVHARVCVLC